MIEKLLGVAALVTLAALVGGSQGSEPEPVLEPVPTRPPPARVPQPHPSRRPTYGPRNPPADRPAYGPKSPPLLDVDAPGRIIRSIVEELVSQARPEMRTELRAVLLEHLSRGNASFAQLAVPCDAEEAPPFERVQQVAAAIAEAHEQPIVITKIGKSGYPLALITVGEADPNDSSWLPDDDAGFGSIGTGLLGTIFQTVVTSAVGTTASMGTQSLIRSMGGEQRLARLMRKYREAQENGNERMVQRIQQKITKSASKIKGRRVDWSEVEAVIGQG